MQVEALPIGGALCVRAFMSNICQTNRMDILCKRALPVFMGSSGLAGPGGKSSEYVLRIGGSSVLHFSNWLHF